MMPCTHGRIPAEPSKSNSTGHALNPNSGQGRGCVGELKDVLSLSLSALGKVEEEICLQASCPINTTEPAHFPLKTDISFCKKVELEIRGLTGSQQEQVI